MKVMYISNQYQQNKETINLINFYLGKADICNDNLIALNKYISELENGTCYDIVFINYDSNILDGYYISDKILSKNIHQKIIIFTEESNLHLMKSFLLKGITNFLLMPIDESQFIEVLKITELFDKKVININSTYQTKDKKKTISYLHKNYFYDYSSGLPNRNKLEYDLKCETLPIIILIDIDKLSIINEIYGLKAGNKVIKELSLFLKNFSVQNNYYLYTISSHSFVLADCVEILDIFKYKKDIEKLFKEIKDFKITHNNQEISIDITAGISMLQGQSLEKADIALKYAKKTKKDYIVYSNMLNDKEKKVNDLQWKCKLKSSINTNKIVTVYQAIVNQDKNIVKYETLMRVRDSNEQLISPYFFLDIAIDTKQYLQISSIIIKKALTDAIYSIKDISINLTYSDILNHQFISEIEDFIILNKIGYKIIFEIVESEYIEDFQLLENFIYKFRKHGIRIAIDDFGSGFSNFEYILKIKPEYIKIDGSLISRITYDLEAYILVKSIINLAKKLNIKTICEFVSTKEIFELLKNLKVDQYQGYYFHKPQEINFMRECKRL